MAQSIGSIGPLGPKGIGGTKALGKGVSTGFKDILSKEISQVNNLQIEAESAINKLATGKTKNTAEVMVAVEKADIAFKSLMAIRNKIVDAYKEIHQMRI